MNKNSRYLVYMTSPYAGKYLIKPAGATVATDINDMFAPKTVATPLVTQFYINETDLGSIYEPLGVNSGLTWNAATNLIQNDTDLTNTFALNLIKSPSLSTYPISGGIIIMLTSVATIYFHYPVKAVTMWIIGGGGGGGGGWNNGGGNDFAGGGGGSGGYGQGGLYALNSTGYITRLSCTVGAGGTGGGQIDNINNRPGYQGGATGFNAYNSSGILVGSLTALGGGGGGGSNIGSSNNESEGFPGGSGGGGGSTDSSAAGCGDPGAGVVQSPVGSAFASWVNTYLSALSGGAGQKSDNSGAGGGGGGAGQVGQDGGVPGPRYGGNGGTSGITITFGSLSITFGGGGGGGAGYNGSSSTTNGGVGGNSAGNGGYNIPGQNLYNGSSSSLTAYGGGGGGGANVGGDIKFSYGGNGASGIIVMQISNSDIDYSTFIS